MLKVGFANHTHQLPDVKDRNVVDIVGLKNFSDRGQVVLRTDRVQVGGHDARNRGKQIHSNLHV
jgi:hypothetical protein